MLFAVSEVSMTNEEAAEKARNVATAGSVRFNSESAHPYQVHVFCEGEMCLGLGKNWEEAFRDSYRVAKLNHDKIKL